MIAFIRQLQTIATLPALLVEYFYETLQQKIVPRKTHLLKEGQHCDSIYFIKKGLFRCYFRDGKHIITTWFMQENDFITSPNSFYNKAASIENIQALEDSEVFYLHFKDLEHIYTQFPEFNRVGRLTAQKYNVILSRYNYICRLKLAEDRYRQFEEDYPELVKRVADKEIASFLGITDAHMSRIKARL